MKANTVARIIALITLFTIQITASAKIVINEIMQSNIDCIMDDLNDFPDSWVELYNDGDNMVNLLNYRIGITDSPATAWELPRLSMPSHTYLIVYCDKAATKLHTDFRLDSGKDCKLYLFDGEEIVDQLPSGMKKQPAPNIAYGRTTDGASDWGYQLTPTPGNSNCGKTVTNKKILDAPVFSVEGCIFSPGQEISLELSLPSGAPADAQIRYTDDGSSPTAKSRLYTDAIKITDTKMIRAVAICDGYLSPTPTTHSYIKFDHDITLPIVSIVTDRKYLYDNKIGIYVDGTYGGGHKNYEYNWRRPVNIEYFGENTTKSEINQLGEARIAGAASRGTALKSLAIYANKRFGEKRFEYEFFPDQRPGLTDYKSLMLRNAGNDFDYLYMRDAIIQRHMAKHTDIDWQAWSPVIFYLNGVYKGILNIRERSNEDNIYTNYNKLEDIDMVENWYELKEGDIQGWYDFQAFYNEHGHTYDEYNQILDVQEFMDVMIANLFFCNLDFPGNNIVFWRPQTEGGRWRVLMKDTDFGLGLYGRDAGYRIFEWINNPNYDPANAWANGYESTRLFRRLMEDATFKREFIDRFAIYMGDFLNYDRTWETWGPMYDLIKYEYPIHRALYNRWWPNYQEELTNACNWLKARVEEMYRQINTYYSTGLPRPLTINKGLSTDDLAQIKVSVNGVQLSRNTYNGKFFVGRQLTVQSSNVKGWIVEEEYSTGRESHTVEGSELSYTMPSTCRSTSINAIVDVDGISDVATDIDQTPEAIYDIAGRRINGYTKGINIVSTPKGTHKIIKR